MNYLAEIMTVSFSFLGMCAAIIAAIGMFQNKKKLKENQISEKLDHIEQSFLGEMRFIDGRFRQLSEQNDQQIGQLRRSIDLRLQEMHHLVEEKLEDRLDRSFNHVREQLEQVHRGLGEMHNLAASMSDLKKVFSNVKTRGVLGEFQLGMILQDILAPGQYKENVCVKPKSRETVEFAVIMPGGNDGPVYLPIDAKFPADAYLQLLDMLETGTAEAISAARAQYTQRLRVFAKDIRDKYINPPQTTDFAILFLPSETLYAQALQIGIFEGLQRDYKVILAGPTTMAALLNSLQMGFQTLAIQKHSSEVWEVLGAVKTEFNRFAAALSSTRQRLEQASGELDHLVGTRTRMIQRRLAQISEPDINRAAELLRTEDEDVN